MKTKFILSLAITLLATVGLASANLITNGDFETGNFTGWTLTPAQSFSNFFVANGIGPDDFTFCAIFQASSNDLDSISQSFATIPGAFYNLSFFFQVAAGFTGSPANEFRVLFNGLLVFDSLNANDSSSTVNFTNLHATGSSATLEFQGRNGQFADVLDNVSVTTSARVPETASTLCLLFLALMAVLGKRQLRSPRWP